MEVKTMTSATVAGKLVVNALTALMVDRKFDATGKFWSDAFIQHSPSRPPHRDGVLQYAQQFSSRTTSKYNIIRVIADIDLVAVHGLTEQDASEPVVSISVFRVKDDKIIEQWEGSQPYAKANPSGRTMLDGPTQPIGTDPSIVNRDLIAEFLKVVLIEGNFARAGEFIDANNYQQHNAMIGDGLSGLDTALKSMASHGSFWKDKAVHRLISQGNFVVTHSEGLFGERPTQFFDIFRIDGNLIVEHWDVIQDISTGSRNTNDVF